MTGGALWEVAEGDWREVTTSGTAARLPSEQHLILLAYGVDPQILLPPWTGESVDGPLEIEMVLKIEKGDTAISTAVGNVARIVEGGTVEANAARNDAQAEKEKRNALEREAAHLKLAAENSQQEQAAVILRLKEELAAAERHAC